MSRHEIHRSHRIGWLRAAVLGANDGIVSTASLIIGVASAQAAHADILLAGVAGLVAGAMSMAAGEYVSVSSQSDTEKADLELEKESLKNDFEFELKELANIYEKRGLDSNLAKQVAEQLMAHDALGAHARDELGIHEISQPKPLQAAFASAVSFIIGGILPLLVSIFSPLKSMVISQYAFSVVFLAISGAMAAKVGGSNIVKSIIRICFWGTVAMGITALVGFLFGVKTA